jgi:hypothetical protein
LTVVSAIAEVVITAAAARTTGAKTNFESIDFIEVSSPAETTLPMGAKRSVKFPSRKRQLFRRRSVWFLDSENRRMKKSR